MNTYILKKAEITRQWHVIDAKDQPLGRLASQVAQLLKGKHKPVYTPHLAMGDYVIVVNASQIKATGNKLEGKRYYRHSNYPGGFKVETLVRRLQRQPTRVIEDAVKGMLPHGPLGSDLMRMLKVYAGATHPHEAQVKGGLQPIIKPRPRKLAKPAASAAESPATPPVPPRGPPGAKG